MNNIIKSLGSSPFYVDQEAAKRIEDFLQELDEAIYEAIEISREALNKSPDSYYAGLEGGTLDGLRKAKALFLGEDVVKLRKKLGWYKSMQNFKELYIKANNENISEFIDLLTTKISASPLWFREEDIVSNSRIIYRFQRKYDGSLPSATLSIFPKNEGEIWYVPNVVPLEVVQLSHEEYNDILCEFYGLFVQPTAEKLRIGVEIFNVENILGEDE